jgi:hypothetical protein
VNQPRIYGWEKPALLKRLGITPRTPGKTRIRPATEQERREHEANMQAQRKAGINTKPSEAGWSSRDIAEARSAYDEARAIAETARPDGKDSGAKGK